MKRELSILLPTHNNICLPLAERLCQLAEKTDSLTWELIVADDGSTDKQTLAANRAITSLPNARLIERPTNSGRAKIRNFLTQQSRYEWLLFIDSDMSVERDDFIRRYAESEGDVVNGGVEMGRNVSPQPNNLRYAYEMKAMPSHTTEERRRQPAAHFHTANFLVSRSIMLAHPFDERFKHYGYEDVLFGKALGEAGINICHIDNPVAFTDFESNFHFVEKSEEGLRTLHRFSTELEGFSGVLDTVKRLERWHLKPAARIIGKPFAATLRRNLTGKRPNIALFNPYKLIYYLQL